MGNVGEIAGCEVLGGQVIALLRVAGGRDPVLQVMTPSSPRRFIEALNHSEHNADLVRSREFYSYMHWDPGPASVDCHGLGNTADG